MINVTKTFLPPIEEYTFYLQKAWDKTWLTNRGELVLELEDILKSYLGVNYLTLTTNGTLPIQLALKQVAKTGSEILTTPFSYVATTSSIVWEGLKPVYVDINPEYLTIDESKIEVGITSKTSAILATHVFGNPCNVEAINIIAKKYNLNVIYDAAHAFGVRYKNTSIFNYGDLSTCSFHATKIFHTGEGGGWITHDKSLHNKMFFSHNFGHNGPGQFYDVGINGKMSELQAAMGLAVFPYFDNIIKKREHIFLTYKNELITDKLKTIKIRENTVWNFSYVPLIFESEDILLKVLHVLMKNKVNARRYFYPSLNTLPYIEVMSMPISEDISKRILCLPTAYDLMDDEIHRIIRLIKTVV